METYVSYISNKSTDRTTELYKKQILLWIFFLLSIASFLPTLTLQYQGEEAVYTLTSIEMAFNNQFFIPTIFGLNYGRPPLFNWAIIPITSILGWEHVLVAARLITIVFTLGTTFLLNILVQRLFHNKTLALLTMVIYLSGDLLFRRGWLAYADPLFSFCVFLAISAAWISLQEKNKYWLIWVPFGLIGAYLSKAFTGYVFYGVAILILFWRYSNRKLLLSYFSIIMHLSAFLFVLVWHYFLSNASHNEIMFDDIVSKFTMSDLLKYGLKITTEPFEIFLRFLPCSAFLMYFWYKSKGLRILPSTQFITQSSTQSITQSIPNNDRNILIIAFLISIINYLPYWLAPFSRIRYLLPLYPFIAILLSYGIYRLNEQKQKFLFYALGISLIIKCLLSFWGFGFYEEKHRGIYKKAAINIIEKVQSYPLYAYSSTATGLSVIANVNVLRLPLTPLTTPPINKFNGFMISNLEHVKNFELVQTYRFGSQNVYLHCQGKACKHSTQTVL